MTQEAAEIWTKFLKDSATGDGIETTVGKGISAYHVVKVLIEDNVKLEERIKKLENQ
jgi:hypothetical protein